MRWNLLPADMLSIKPLLLPLHRKMFRNHNSKKTVREVSRAGEGDSRDHKKLFLSSIWSKVYHQQDAG